MPRKPRHATSLHGAISFAVVIAGIGIWAFSPDLDARRYALGVAIIALAWLVISMYRNVETAVGALRRLVAFSHAHDVIAAIDPAAHQPAGFVDRDFDEQLRKLLDG